MQSQMIQRLVDLLVKRVNDSFAQLSETKPRAALPTSVSDADIAAARARQVAWLRGGGLKELADPEQRGQVWR